MTDRTSTIADVEYADSTLVVVGDYVSETYYFGDFSYPNGQWKGTITAIFGYFYGEEQWHVTGLSLSTRYATAGTTTEAAYRAAFFADDTMIGSQEDDKLVGYAGNDLLTGRSGNDHLWGSAGDDDVLGQLGSDVLNGGAGDDLLDGGFGADLMLGGYDDDIYVVETTADRIIEGAGQGLDVVFSEVDCILAPAVEILSLVGAGPLRGTGNALANSISGNSGDNSLSGGNGADVLLGSAGLDFLLGGSANDVLQGNSEADRLFGSIGDDILRGGYGNDTLAGGVGEDIIGGDWGVDVLSGGLGRDDLTGGAGADVFRFRSGEEIGIGSSQDLILDFDHRDIVDLRGIDADETTGANESFRFVWAREFSGTPGDLRFASGSLSGDVDGDRVADFALGVEDVAGIFGSDLML
jgi:Ca2+-binding RTX toxin-like protein